MKTLSAVLSVVLLLGAPGLAPYQAFAATFEEGGAPLKIVPPVTAGSPLAAPINAPEILGAPQLPAALIPAPSEAAIPSVSAAASATAAAAQTASSPASASVLAGTQKLAAAIAPSAKAEAGSQQAALDHAFTGSAPSSVSESLPVSAAPEACPSGGCPFHALFGKSNRPSPAGRPKPSDVGILHKTAMRAMGATWWVWDRVIDSKWDKMPPKLAAIYLYFNEQYLRLHLWDAAAEPTTDTKSYPAATEAQKKYRSADGSYFDEKDPAMAKAGSRFNQVRKPSGPPNANWDKMDPNPFVISEKLMQRDHDAQGNPIIKEIGANSWFVQIQDQLHDWFNHEQRPMTDHPVSFTVPKGHPLKPEGGEVVINRTKTDDSVPADYQGPAIHRNGETSPWDKSSLYGSSAETQAQVRSFEKGHLKIGADGWLPDDAAKPGVPKTGFNNNMSVELAMHNNVWAREHNFVADAIAREYHARGIELSDEELFQKARLRITGVNARNHTIPWTQWLFAGSETGQQIMWADWYGFLGKRFKLAYMRWTDRHPRLAKLTDPIIRSELLFGVPGTTTNHFGKHYNFTEEFVDVYRMHQLIRDTMAVHHMETRADGTVEISILDSVKLQDRVGVKTQAALRAHSIDDWALTLGKQNVGELTINNMPDGLRNLTAQDGVKDGHKVDLGAIDILRTRERLEASTYAKFTVRLGERPPRTFEELTGGNQEAADKLRAVYKSVKDVDFQIGILSERKPFGYFLGNRQFKVFVLSAPARVKNDRFLSSLWNAATYDQSGIDYMETNNFAHVLARAVPSLKALDIEAMKNPYMSYPELGWLPKALAEDSSAAAASARQTLKTGRRFAGALIVGVAVATALGAPSLATVPLLAGAALALLSPLALAIPILGFFGGRGFKKISAAGEAMAQAATFADADKAAAAASKGALVARLAVLGVAATTLFLAAVLAIGAPVLAVVAALAGLALGKQSFGKISAAVAAVDLQRTELKTRLRKASPHIDASTLPGETSIAKRYWFLLGDHKTPVATFKSTYASLRHSGVSAFAAFKLAGLAHLVFPAKTQKNMTPEEKARWKPGRFDIFVPNIIDAHSYANTRTYLSREDAAKQGLKAGDIDMKEFERMVDEFGGLRGYLTAYDFARMREANFFRDKAEGRGTTIQRFIGRWQAGRRAGDLLNLFADRVVWEDGMPGGRVPAISRERLLQFYQGSAQAELDRERR